MGYKISKIGNTLFLLRPNGSVIYIVGDVTLSNQASNILGQQNGNYVFSLSTHEIDVIDDVVASIFPEEIVSQILNITPGAIPSDASAIPDPTSLSATAGDKQASLQWTNGTGTQWSEIQVATNSAFTANLKSFYVGSAAHTFIVKSLVNGTAYYYRVRNKANGSPASAWVPGDSTVTPTA